MSALDHERNSNESSDVSRFKVDGVVAEMVIEVEENESHQTPLAEKSSSELQILNNDEATGNGSEKEQDEKLLSHSLSDDEILKEDNRKANTDEDESDSEIGSKNDERNKKVNEKESFSLTQTKISLKEKMSEDTEIISAMATSRPRRKKIGEMDLTVEDITKEKTVEDNQKANTYEDESDSGIGSKNDEKTKKVSKKESSPLTQTKISHKEKMSGDTEIISAMATRGAGRPRRKKIGEMDIKEKTVAGAGRTRKRKLEAEVDSAEVKHVGRPSKKRLEESEVSKKVITEEKPVVERSRRRKTNLDEKEVNKKDKALEKSIGKLSKHNRTNSDDSATDAKRKTPNNSVKAKSLSLGDIPGLSTRIKEVQKNGLRLLYRTIHNQWPSNSNTEKIVSELLGFEGFSFDKASPEYDKRRKLLASFVDTNISLLSKILGIRAGPKSAMINNILNFLLKPSFKLCESDKFLQPFVRLERISLDNKYVLKSKKTEAVKTASSPDTVATPTAVAIPTAVKKVNPVPSKTPSLKPSAKKKAKPGPKGSAAPKKHSEEVIEVKSEILSGNEDLPSIRNSSAVLESSLSSSKTRFSEVNDDDLMEITYIKTEEPEGEAKNTGEDDMSEETLSSEEAAIAEKKKDEITYTTKKKTVVKKVQKPLVMFSNIKDSVNNADLQPLQRLHILLFGASEKPEQLRHNILAFGGFPFKEGSEDWKQKEFLLSLLAPNTLREYLKILCIEFLPEEDQASLISKLMVFLHAPGGKSVVTEEVRIKNNIKPKSILKTKVVTKEATKNEIKKKLPKKKEDEKKKGPRHRKVLMDETQLRRLEADIAREQRILARERKSDEMRRQSLGLPIYQYTNRGTIGTILPKTTKQPATAVKNDLVVSNNVVIGRKIPVNTSLVNLAEINALLQTVYKRRALKKAGVQVSIPNTGTVTRLGDLENVKFMVVTANYNDLDMLHHLIFMLDATKAKVRKNILEFSGFGFDEDSAKYQKRMTFLNNLGYDISKRIAFILGLSSFDNKISQQDLNELIMYFLMSPSKIKHAPIRDMPQDFFRDPNKDMNVLVLKQTPPPESTMFVKTVPPAKKKTTPKKTNLAKRVIQTQNSEVMEYTTTPPNPPSNTKPIITADGLKLYPVQKVVLPPQSVLNKSPIATRTPVPLQSLPPFILQQTPGSGACGPLKPQLILEPITTLTSGGSVGGHMEQLIVQQQPEGGGPPKMFKLVKLPTNHPLATAIGNKSLHVSPQPNTNIQVAMGPPVIRVPQPSSTVFANTAPGNILPPGIILFKKDLQGSQTTIIPNAAAKVVSKATPTPSSGDDGNASVPSEEFVLPNEADSSLASDCWSNDEEAEVLHPLESNPPTDEDLFESIQDIIHSSNFEDITLRNVIDKVSSQYADTDLRLKHHFMKDCIKRIIIGTP